MAGFSLRRLVSTRALPIQQHFFLTSNPNFVESTEAPRTTVFNSHFNPRVQKADLKVDKRLLNELEAMGFPLARSTRALHYSGNSSIEDAINWIIDHENDSDIDQMPLVVVNIDIQSPETSNISGQVMLKAKQLRERAGRKKEKEEKELEREREKERIRAGKELLKTKTIREDNERKRFLASQKAEKEEEKRARDKICQKLQQDKIERRGWLGLPLEDTASVNCAPSLKQEKKNSVPVKHATLPADARKTEILRNCLISLKRNHVDDDAKVRRAFQTLLLYVRNVIKNPDDEKFRKIRLGNQAFQDRVGNLQEGTEFLELCGFEIDEGGDFLLLPGHKVDMALLKSAGTVLNSAITNPFFGLLSR